MPPHTPIRVAQQAMCHGTLPAPVRRYLARALPRDAGVPRLVRVTQEGEMFQTPGGRARPFTAVEELAVGEVAFSWRARFPLLPPLSMRIHDGYADGRGWMRGRILGVPYLRTEGPDIDAGAALRYLAELPWVPHAMYANPQLSWFELGRDVVAVSATTGGIERTVSFHFDDAGDIVRAFTGARPRDGDRPRPWSGAFGAYADIAGIRIPTFAEVRWEMPDGPFVYWRGRVTTLEIVN